MFAIEDNTSSDCAREIRGTASIANAVIGRRARSSTSSGFSAGRQQADQGRARLHPVQLLRRRRVHAEHDIGGRRVTDRRPGLDVRRIREGRSRSRPRVDHDVVAQRDQLLHRGRRRRDARLPRRRLLQGPDDHRLVPSTCNRLGPASPTDTVAARGLGVPCAIGLDTSPQAATYTTIHSPMTLRFDERSTCSAGLLLLRNGGCSSSSMENMSVLRHPRHSDAQIHDRSLGTGRLRFTLATVRPLE